MLREEHRLRVFKNRVLKGTFGPMTEEAGENSVPFLARYY
jgi:hypothetical protein